MALHWFADDTNTHGERGRPIAVAGVMFEDERLEGFTDAWQAATETLAKPFRAADCFHRQGQFRGASQDECRSIHLELAKIIGEYRGPIFYAGILPEDYTAAIKNAPSFDHLTGGPFALCATAVAQTIGDHLRGRGDERFVSYWLEDGSPRQAEADGLLRRMTANQTLQERYRIKHHAFLPKGHAAGLCAADCVAWELQRNLSRNEENTERIDAIIAGGREPVFCREMNSTTPGIYGLVNAFYGVGQGH